MTPAPRLPPGALAPPRAVRRLARALLVFTVASLPLSISGMQIGIVALAVLALGARLAGRGVARATPLDGALAVFFGTLVVSTLASGRPLEAGGWDRPWIVVGYFGVYWWLEDRAHARRLALVLIAAGAVAGAYGILQHHTGADWYREALGRPTRVRPRLEGAAGFAVVGFFKNYLTYAHAMIFPLAFATTFALGGARWAWVAAGLLVTAIAYSTARGVWLALGASALVLAGVGRRRALAGLAGLIALAGVVAALSPGLRAQAEPIFTLGGANAGRIAIYRANLDIVRDHPLLGLGFGRYRTAARPYYDAWPAADRRSHAHSNLLQLAAEAGLLGLAAFCLLFAVVLRLGWEAIAAAPDAGAWSTAAGAWVAVCAFLLAGLTQYNFGDNEVATAMWVTVALLVACRDDAR